MTPSHLKIRSQHPTWRAACIQRTYVYSLYRPTHSHTAYNSWHTSFYTMCWRRSITRRLTLRYQINRSKMQFAFRLKQGYPVRYSWRSRRTFLKKKSFVCVCVGRIGKCSFKPLVASGYYMSHLSEHYTRQAMYVQRNIEARSRNHCCRWKAVSITYSECV